MPHASTDPRLPGKASPGLAGASPADPLAIMARALTRGAPAPQEPPETVFLAWLLSVPRDLDPAEAAGRMLARFVPPRPEPCGTGRERLIELLNDTRRWPRRRLSCLATGRGARPAARRETTGRRAWR